MCARCGRTSRVAAALGRRPCRPAARFSERARNLLQAGRYYIALTRAPAWVHEWTTHGLPPVFRAGHTPRVP